MNTNTFPAGSEFRVDYTIEKPNPRYVKGSWNARTMYATTLSHHKSDVFETYEAAMAYGNDVIGERWSINVKTPGSKRFVPTYHARKADAA